MKKLLFFVAACVALVACDNNEPENTAFHAGQVVTISASAGSSANQAPSRKINGQRGSDNTITFTWEEGDSILVKVGEATAVFKVTNISADGKSADFTGTMPAEGNNYDVQFPVNPLPLDTQYYAGVNVLPKNVMPFEAKNCTLDQTDTLSPTKAVLQLNIGDMVTINTVSVAMGTDGETFDTNYDLILETPVTPTDEAQPFFLVVEPGTYYFYASWKNESSTYYGPTTSSALTFTAGECLNMEECCLAAGTRITMADGTTKLIEDVQLGDLVRTFDHETGAISSAQICLAWKGETKERSLDLTFASGKKLSIVGTHDLLLENTRKYVRVNSGNVADYVGKRFYNAELGAWDELVSYEMSKDLVEYYCIYSANHINCVAEGLLTCPDDVDFFLNIYELDTHLKADADQLAADIAQYGLYNIAQRFPDYAEYKEQMEDLGFLYIYIAMGKGLVTREELLALLDSNWN